ncbi:YhgE/Pip family protein [Microbacterium schleiferi]|uniref:YhgE/Pip family protein n=1 Tax=Microbacterium schleiferi TaxID=69362 RepID=UPI00311D47EB
MKVPAMIAAELRRLTATRMSILALVALMLVPVLYGGVYLWANQDPYGRLSEVPVALVNLDTGAQNDGASVNCGDEVADNLLRDGSFDWQSLDAGAAEQALTDGSVDFIVTIPADFSTALVSTSGSNPHQARLELETNDANNYLASTIGDQAIEKIRASVAQLVGQEAASRLLSGIADIRSNLQDAVTGATELSSGAAQASDGSARLADGAAQLSSGLTQLADAAPGLADGAAQVSQGTATLAGYADRASSASQQAVNELPAVRQDIIDALTAEGLTPAEIDAVLARLDPLAGAVQNANAQVQSAVSSVDALAAGAAQVAAGAQQLSGGLQDAASGGVQLDAASQTLAGGLTQLDEGAATLRDGLASGVAQIPDSDAALREAQAQTISDPVAVETGKVASAGDYGAGLAPFFAALAGWIGIYALFLIVKPISRRAVTALHSPVRVTLAGWLTPGLLGGLQMLALFGILAAALGFAFTHPLATLGVMVFASLTYAAIILALNVWLGSVGQFLGLVLMVLQLVTAGGTFPWQTLPEPLTWLHHILPMGYVVDGMRQLMYGGDLARVGTDLGILSLWLVGALAFAAIGVARMTHGRTLRDLQPSLIG